MGSLTCDVTFIAPLLYPSAAFENTSISNSRNAFASNFGVSVMVFLPSAGWRTINRHFPDGAANTALPPPRIFDPTKMEVEATSYPVVRSLLFRQEEI